MILVVELILPYLYASMSAVILVMRMKEQQATQRNLKRQKTWAADDEKS